MNRRDYLLRRISIQKHLRQIVELRLSLREGNLPDTIENFAVPLWRLRNSQSFCDFGNLTVVPADQNNLAGKFVKNGADHLLDAGVVVLNIVVDRQIQSSRQRQNRFERAFTVFRRLSRKDVVRSWESWRSALQRNLPVLADEPLVVRVELAAQLWHCRDKQRRQCDGAG